MRLIGPIIMSILTLILIGCGEEISLSGEWCGKAVLTAPECVDGKDIGYLKLVHIEEKVFVTACDDYEDRSCNEFEAVVYDNALRLTDNNGEILEDDTAGWDIRPDILTPRDESFPTLYRIPQ
jgi:hypothetical protein